LFDDKSEDIQQLTLVIKQDIGIQQLTLVIKQDIGTLNRQIGQLQEVC